MNFEADNCSPNWFCVCPCSARWRALPKIVLRCALQSGEWERKNGFFPPKRVCNGISSFCRLQHLMESFSLRHRFTFSAVTSEKLIISINSETLQIAALDTHRPTLNPLLVLRIKAFRNFPIHRGQPRVKNLNWKLCYDSGELSDFVLSRQTSVELQLGLGREI